MDKCNSLLSKINKEPEEILCYALYSVRNLLVHDYRCLSNDMVIILNEINLEFEKLIIDILIMYREE